MKSHHHGRFLGNHHFCCRVRHDGQLWYMINFSRVSICGNLTIELHKTYSRVFISEWCHMVAGICLMSCCTSGRSRLRTARAAYFLVKASSRAVRGVGLRRQNSGKIVARMGWQCGKVLAANGAKGGNLYGNVSFVKRQCFTPGAGSFLPVL